MGPVDWSVLSDAFVGKFAAANPMTFMLLLSGAGTFNPATLKREQTFRSFAITAERSAVRQGYGTSSSGERYGYSEVFIQFTRSSWIAGCDGAGGISVDRRDLGPSRGDQITDGGPGASAGHVWRVISVEKQLDGTLYRCTCRQAKDPVD